MPLTEASLPFDPAGIILDPKGGLSRQLYEALKTRALDGRLSPGVRLPASRDMARLLNISRNSVLRAYEQLFAEGFTETRVGDGTYVAEVSIGGLKQSTHLPTAFSTGLPTALSTKNTKKPGHIPSTNGVCNGSLTAANGPSQQPRPSAPMAFRVGIPAIDLFPFSTWSKLQRDFWRAPDPALLGYQPAAGDVQLRELIAAYLRSSRGLICDSDQILITCGAQHAIRVCAQLLLSPGDTAAVENPGYRAAAGAIANAGVKLIGIAVDGEGLQSAQLKYHPHCRLVYVTPAHQYPTGVTLSLARRLELLAWAQRTEGWIIEDDYDGEYRYSGAPLAPLASLDPNGRVLYVGTFSKVAFPALRLGYLVLPKPLVERFVQRCAVDNRHLEIGVQRVMARFMAEGHFQRHVRRMRKAALARRDALFDSWPGSVPGCGPLPAVNAGLHLKIDVAGIAQEKRLIEKAAQQGVELNPLSSYWLADTQVPGDSRAGLVLGFAGVPEAQIARATQGLRRAWL